MKPVQYEHKLFGCVHFKCSQVEFFGLKYALTQVEVIQIYFTNKTMKSANLLKLKGGLSKGDNTIFMQNNPQTLHAMFT